MLTDLRLKTYWWLPVILIIFLLFRVPAINNLYHQDEYKWVLYSHPEIMPPGTVPHPPFTELIYTKIGPLVGDYNFRVIPLSFSLINLFLLFFLVKTIFDKRTAIIASFIFSISFYSILASTTVDVDGAVLPFFMLIFSIGYFKIKLAKYQLDGNLKWLAVLIVGAVGGFLVKVSGALPILAFGFDFFLERGVFDNKKKIFKYGVFSLIFVFVMGLVLYFSKFIFPFFRLEYAFSYWKHFLKFADRGWMQTLIQFVKSIMYTSPGLILIPILAKKDILVKARPYFMFITFGLIFYLIAFDFSVGALDRYLQFLVIPLSIISAAVISEIIKAQKFVIKDAILGSILAISIFMLQFGNHYIPSLYPKTEWLSRILFIKWNFVFPFTGGSGPTGFYVSFIFIALVWVLSLVFLVLALKKREVSGRVILVILILSGVYNMVFLEEFLFGKINGSPYKLFKDAEKIIVSDPNINQVVVYNDIGGFNIQKDGKYARRLYAAPQFEETYREYFKNYNGFVLYIDIPRIEENSFYFEYLKKCTKVYERTDKKISSNIYSCNSF